MGRTKKDKSLAKSKFYQRQYPNIPPMSSTQLLSLQQKQNEENPIIIIDVRTKAERSVSMIPGSIPLSNFKRRMTSSSSSDDDEVSSLPPNADIVLYCTIGYRSGMEARRLNQLFPLLKGRIYNLDGIVSYTHASSSSATTNIHEHVNNGEHQQTTSMNDHPAAAEEPPTLINPKTNESTNLVHTFGPNWDCVNESFETTHFSLPTLLLKMGQVGLLSTLRTGQCVVHYGKQKCGCGCFGKNKKGKKRSKELEMKETESM
uniref:Rhodanese domain-containing protein n=1 Tax=Helicotheca tamesis TaxID=374047 RepID=A0A7S2HKA1_9STRA|mmetsp:Transcript_18894/g.25999  ORF Transcript_18894/g.25999 Transcript_18894/m.25999 type:complete len:260 (+) Transcript_18894:128-907(+)|eukprot:CAMPEP_0185736608 /NCGR_PEP_ID=MMETSP1171-20130828/28342_1 /TAXON_ID=374046 /ORGANISM="Helicotheca tamensis, Strain CCMP826" /LENGTH=259 /DNA_ID=CAMNT_0028407281 /DNA_START=57 /DNA_END=836 /DNA_ORIENTATION=-